MYCDADGVDFFTRSPVDCRVGVNEESWVEVEGEGLGSLCCCCGCGGDISGSGESLMEERFVELKDFVSGSIFRIWLSFFLTNICPFLVHTFMNLVSFLHSLNVFAFNFVKSSPRYNYSTSFEKFTF